MSDTNSPDPADNGIVQRFYSGPRPDQECERQLGLPPGSVTVEWGRRSAPPGRYIVGWHRVRTGDPECALHADPAVVAARAPDRERERAAAADLAAECEGLAADAEIIAWIRQHGSERLRLALDLGELPRSLAIYRDERLALERPGWAWLGEARTRERRNASLAELRALADERAADGGAELIQIWEPCLCGYGGEGHCDGDRCAGAFWYSAITRAFIGRPIYRAGLNS